MSARPRIRRGVILLLGSAALGACAMPPVQTSVAGPQEPRLEADRVVLADGAALPLKRWAPAAGGPRAAVVALHGLNDYNASFTSAGEHLAANGFVVYAYDQRGFGGSDQRGFWAGGDVLADDVRQVATLVRARHPGVPLYVLGESMGGAVLLCALELEPRGWLDGAVLLAPAVWSRRDMTWYERSALGVLSHTLRGLELRTPRGHPASDDAEALRRLHEDPLVLHATRVDVLAGISDLMDEVTGVPGEVRVPLLVLYGARDNVIPARAFCNWIATLDTGGPWRLALYPNGWHMLLRDLDAATALADLTAWLVAPGADLPSGFLAPKPRDAASCLASVRALAPAAGH